MSGDVPSTMAPTPVTDKSCMDFISSQNCRVSDVKCHLPNSRTYKHMCRCPIDRSECYQYKATSGENQTYSISCPCTPYQPFVASAIVFAIVATVMFVACMVGLFINRRSPRTIALKKAKVRQDPINIQLVTDHDYASWQTREAAMQNFGTNLVASLTADPQMNPENVSNNDNHLERQSHNVEMVQISLNSDTDQNFSENHNPNVHSVPSSEEEETIVQIDIENQT